MVGEIEREAEGLRDEREASKHRVRDSLLCGRAALRAADARASLWVRGAERRTEPCEVDEVEYESGERSGEVLLDVWCLDPPDLETLFDKRPCRRLKKCPAP